MEMLDLIEATRWRRFARCSATRRRTPSTCRPPSRALGVDEDVVQRLHPVELQPGGAAARTDTRRQLRRRHRSAVERQYPRQRSDQRHAARPILTAGGGDVEPACRGASHRRSRCASASSTPRPMPLEPHAGASQVSS